MIFTSIGGVLIVLGIIVSFVHAKYKKNTSEPEIKKQTVKSLGGFIGHQMILIGFLLISIGISNSLKINPVTLLLVVLFFVTIIYSIMQMRSYLIGSVEVKNGAKIVFSAILVLTIFMGLVIIYSLSAPTIVYPEDYLEIRSLNGVKIHLRDIDAITFDNRIPKIIDLEEGLHISKYYRGKFELAEMGPALLYINYRDFPYIYIFLKQKKGTIVLTRNNPKKTQQLYEEIKEHWYNYVDTKVVDELKEKYIF